MRRTMQGRFLGREILSRPKCPFCGGLIEPPAQGTGPLALGRCSCGAAYASDVTGHDLGTALLDALAFACEGDSEAAWNLVPGEDYLEDRLDNYDEKTHLVVPGGAYEGRRIAGALYFVRRLDGQGEFKRVSKDREKGAIPGLKPKAPPKRARRNFSKSQVEDLVRTYDMETLLALAQEDPRLLRHLQRLLYSVDPVLRWRSADAMGQACAVIIPYDAGMVSRLLQGLFTSVTDTAASSWGSLPAIGEIIRNCPEAFGGYLIQIYGLSRDRALLGDILSVLGRVAEIWPDLVKPTARSLLPFLNDADGAIRGRAACILGWIGIQEANPFLQTLIHDSAKVSFYEHGQMIEKTVGQVASEALGRK